MRLNFLARKKKNKIVVANQFNVKSVIEIGRKVSNSKRGFLIHHFSPAELKKIVKSKKSKVYLAKGRRGVEAYLVGHFGKRWLDNPSVKKSLKIYSKEAKDIIAGDYAYLQHIAVANEAHGRRAIDLERKFFSEAKERGFNYVLGEVALAPLNKVSLDLHLKGGGELIASYVDPESKVTWGVISRKL